VFIGNTVQQDYWCMYYSWILFWDIIFLDPAVFPSWAYDFKERGIADARLGGFHWLWAASELLALEIDANEWTL
jgi:hypothetical protein